jgi:hypothetical protein
VKSLIGQSEGGDNFENVVPGGKIMLKLIFENS